MGVGSPNPLFVQGATVLVVVWSDSEGIFLFTSYAFKFFSTINVSLM